MNFFVAHPFVWWWLTTGLVVALLTVQVWQEDECDVGQVFFIAFLSTVIWPVFTLAFVLYKITEED